MDILKFVLSLAVPLLGVAAMFGALSAQLKELTSKLGKLDDDQREQLSQLHTLALQVTKLEGRFEGVETRADQTSRHKAVDPLVLPGSARPSS